MDTLGLKELRQHASEYVKRAEAGETLLITVAGRPSAILGPAGRRIWQSFEEIADIFATPADASWESDRRQINDTVVDPWEGR